MYQYPPPWGYQMPPNMNDDHFKRGIVFAAKLAAREDREKERKKFRDKKDREEARKEMRTTRRSFLIALELYILGVMSYPFVGPLYNAAKIAAAHWGTN